MFYSSPANLISPGFAAVMGEGWETARRRDEGNDWVTVCLAGQGVVRLAELDTSHFKGNAPGWAALSGLRGTEEWVELLPRTRLQPDTRHRFLLTGSREVTHVRMDVYPDGGMARLRLHGALNEAGRRDVILRWFNTLPTTQATAVLAPAPGAGGGGRRRTTAHRRAAGAWRRCEGSGAGPRAAARRLQRGERVRLRAGVTRSRAPGGRHDPGGEPERRHGLPGRQGRPGRHRRDAGGPRAPRQGHPRPARRHRQPAGDGPARGEGAAGHPARADRRPVGAELGPRGRRDVLPRQAAGRGPGLPEHLVRQRPAHPGGRPHQPPAADHPRRRTRRPGRRAAVGRPVVHGRGDHHELGRVRRRTTRTSRWPARCPTWTVRRTSGASRRSPGQEPTRRWSRATSTRPWTSRYPSLQTMAVLEAFTRTTATRTWPATLGPTINQKHPDQDSRRIDYIFAKGVQANDTVRFVSHESDHWGLATTLDVGAPSRRDQPTPTDDHHVAPATGFLMSRRGYRSGMRTLSRRWPVSRLDAELVRRSGDLPPTPADRGFRRARARRRPQQALVRRRRVCWSAARERPAGPGYAVWRPSGSPASPPASSASGSFRAAVRPPSCCRCRVG